MFSGQMSGVLNLEFDARFRHASLVSGCQLTFLSFLICLAGSDTQPQYSRHINATDTESIDQAHGSRK